MNASRFENNLFNYSRALRHIDSSLSFHRKARSLVWKGYEGAHISRLKIVRERFYVATSSICSADGAPVVVKQLYGVVGRAIDISSIPLSLPGNPACHDYCLQAACTMKAPAIAAVGTEERYRGCGHGEGEGLINCTHYQPTISYFSQTRSFRAYSSSFTAAVSFSLFDPRPVHSRPSLSGLFFL